MQQKKGLLVVSLLFFIVSHCVYCNDRPTADWLIVGAGPAGIATIGVLIDLGIAPEDIVWLDPEFNVGRMGAYYHNVPGNSKVAEFVYFVNACNVFRECTSPELEALRASQELTKFENLSAIIEPLKTITKFLLTKVQGVQSTLVTLNFSDDIWHIGTADNQLLHARHVILATGSRPRTLDYEQQKIIPLDVALDPDNLALLLTPHDIVGVVGGAHSAILMLKFLSNISVKHTFNFYNKPIVYAVNMGSWTLYSDIGIKGTTAEWAKNVLEKNPPENLTRIKSDDELLRRIVPVCSRVIYAIGYERNPLPAINGNEPIMSYDKHSGTIAPRLFGIGIAFPEFVDEGNGHCSYRIGLREFMRFAQRVIPQWMHKNIIDSYATYDDVIGFDQL
jgi:hypothetical protein